MPATMAAGASRVLGTDAAVGGKTSEGDTSERGGPVLAERAAGRKVLSAPTSFTTSTTGADVWEGATRPVGFERSPPIARELCKDSCQYGQRFGIHKIPGCAP